MYLQCRPFGSLYFISYSWIIQDWLLRKLLWFSWELFDSLNNVPSKMFVLEIPSLDFIETPFFWFITEMITDVSYWHSAFAKIVHLKSNERIYQTNVPENEYFLIRWGSLIRCQTTKVWYDRLITNSFYFGGEFYTTLQYFKVTGQILTGKTGPFYFRLFH